MSPFGRILILGSAGQLGRELQRSFHGAGEVVAYDLAEVNLANADETRAAIRSVAPDLILNASAYTAVDRAETEKDLATAVNAVAPRIMAEEARSRDIPFVHYSTDYVFDGSKTSPWVETDAPGPLNHYGASKLAGEQAVQEVGGKYLIFRTSWVYGPHGNNFLFTMLRLGKEKERMTVVDDQYGAPTTSTSLADATRTILDGIHANKFGASESWAGLYHMTCGGSTTWCGFAREIFRGAEQHFAQRAPEVAPITTESWPTPAKRPRNSVLSNEKLRERFSVKLPEWQVELERTFRELLARKASSS